MGLLAECLQDRMKLERKEQNHGSSSTTHQR
jgi:hypothetical protein